MMQTFELIAPCHFGLESVVKNEIYDLGYEITEVDDGRVTFEGDAEAIVRANLSLRTAERILLKIGSFHAETFEDLFQGTRALPWEELLPKDARFWVTKASSVKSKLFSPSDIQSVMKKAMVSRMSEHYGLTQFPENGASYPVRVFIKKDDVTVAVDTTGESLHKRGYRKYKVQAPIAENLAAGLIALTPWRPGRMLVDPFCGSGTFLIEAAMISAHIAPGLSRSFTAEAWTVADLIHFQVRPVAELSHPRSYGFIITNPPYGERLEKGQDQDLLLLYKTLGERFQALSSWSLYVITSFSGAEKALGLKAQKNRKIYNGMIKTYFYMFPGPKPKAGISRRLDSNEEH